MLNCIDLDFDESGNQINKQKKVDVFDYLNFNLDYLKGSIESGHDFANCTLIKIQAGISVMLALEQRAQTGRHLVDTTA